MMFCMRTIINLTPELVAGLAIIAKEENKSRAALIREAVHEYLARRTSPDMSAAFGIWAERGVDGLDYEAALREEWDES